MREPASASGILRARMAAPSRSWVPGWYMLRRYPLSWVKHDLFAGLVLTAVLIPVGMGYAQASGLPPIQGLYATIIPLLVYALFGPSRILVLGPDSTLVAVIAALILPMAAGDAGRAVTLAAALALMSGLFLVLISLARLGVMADLFSKPIRLGFFNAVALTVVISQFPKVLGFSSQGDDLVERAVGIVQGIVAGKLNLVALALGGGSLAAIVLLKRLRPRWPGVLLAVVGSTVASAVLDLHRTSGVGVIGPMPQGLPTFALPWVSWQDLKQMMPGAAMIALLTFADMSVLSRALAAREGRRVSQDQEMLALGLANIASGLFQGFSVSCSSSRTPVAEAAGSRTQLTGVVGALAIALLLIFEPRLLQDLPTATLGAVVIAACLSFVDVRGMLALRRQRPVEFWLAVISFLVVGLVGVMQGIVITILLSMAVLVWNAWHPHWATLARVDGRKGWHDVQRNPEGRRVPGLVLFRFDEQLFFANADIFREQVMEAVDASPTPVKRVVIAADAITDVDLTAADMLLDLKSELTQQGIELHFGGLRSQVQDRLKNYGLLERLGGEGHFAPTVGNAVNLYRERHAPDWKDWDET